MSNVVGPARRPWHAPYQFLLVADVGGLGVGVILWAAGLAAYVPHICRNDPAITQTISSTGDPTSPPVQTMVDSVTWRCDFGDGSGFFRVVDHGPLVWSIFWALLLLLGARTAVRHQRVLTW